MKEVQILKKLDHPNIIKYYGSFVEDQYLSIVMEYAEGGDLHKILKQQKDSCKRFTEHELWHYTYEISLAINWLHSRNIIHRDIKTMNILLTGDNHVKIGDLGASKIWSAAAQMHVTRVGTPLYLAPELVRQNAYDSKVDIWALGCVLYHLAAFDSPFRGENLIALGNNIVNRKPKALPPCYSGRMQSVVMRLLEKKASERPNIQQVLQMLPSNIKTGYVEPAPPPTFTATGTLDFDAMKPDKEAPRPSSPKKIQQKDSEPEVTRIRPPLRPIPQQEPTDNEIAKKEDRSRIYAIGYNRYKPGSTIRRPVSSYKSTRPQVTADNSMKNLLRPTTAAVRPQQVREVKSYSQKELPVVVNRDPSKQFITIDQVPTDSKKSLHSYQKAQHLQIKRPQTAIGDKTRSRYQLKPANTEDEATRQIEVKQPKLRPQSAVISPLLKEQVYDRGISRAASKLFTPVYKQTYMRTAVRNNFESTNIAIMQPDRQRRPSTSKISIMDLYK